jgi:hypothetical protein
VQQVTDFAYYTASNARVQTKALLLSNAANGGNGGRGGVKYLSGEERMDTTNMNRWIVFKPCAWDTSYA